MNVNAGTMTVVLSIYQQPVETYTIHMPWSNQEVQGPKLPLQLKTQGQHTVERSKKDASPASPDDGRVLCSAWFVAANAETRCTEATDPIRNQHQPVESERT